MTNTQPNMVDKHCVWQKKRCVYSGAARYKSNHCPNPGRVSECRKSRALQEMRAWRHTDKALAIKLLDDMISHPMNIKWETAAKKKGAKKAAKKKGAKKTGAKKRKANVAQG